jgi:hypothetical protein
MTGMHFAFAICEFLSDSSGIPARIHADLRIMVDRQAKAFKGLWDNRSRFRGSLTAKQRVPRPPAARSREMR